MQTITVTQVILVLDLKARPPGLSSPDNILIMVAGGSELYSW